MEIGSQEHVIRRGSSQFFHYAQTLIYKSCIRPEVFLRDSLFAPEIDHLRQRAKIVQTKRFRRGFPNPSEHAGDDHILRCRQF